MKKEEIKEVRDSLLVKRVMANPSLSKKDLLGTGSTLLNLACSGRVSGGILKGSYVHLVGRSGSGKSWLSMSILAEAAQRKEFDDYRFIADLPENGALMDKVKYFGGKMASRVEAIEPSSTVEEFYDRLDDIISEGQPFIWIEDSYDALDDEESDTRISSRRAAREGDKKAAGSFGTGRAKEASARLRQVASGLAKPGSVLVLISQTRDNIGFGAQFNPDVYSGGNALKFYAHLQLWTSVFKDIKKKVGGKDRNVGILSKIKIEKNRLTGREGVVEVPIYYSFGIDDLGSCVDYLIEEGHWSQTREKAASKKRTGPKERPTSVVAPEFDFSGKVEDLIQWVEKHDKESTLRGLVAKVWNEIEAKCALERKPRYE